MGARRAVAPPQEGAQAPHRTAAVQAPPELGTSERLPRRARLGRGTELTACWEEGRKLRTPSLDLAWRANQAGHPRLGIVVPRFQQTAVARNRLRRRLREVLRRGPLLTLPPVDLVVRAKRTAYAASFAVLRAELTEATARIA
ncbi:MAG: ribonuclease P protein component [Gemmatimonadetes bacterium]|nr:MAG: ribonuclease P protein component [Gemmatimonadota bacterium]PYO84033.1 MAG: ribonuclease P protein component [Gemmatimonadota bacterium]PYP61765.1 MAG: ribonuclease P protein component [Gemmatimonadota bacterium]